MRLVRFLVLSFVCLLHLASLAAACDCSSGSCLGCQCGCGGFSGGGNYAAVGSSFQSRHMTQHARLTIDTLAGKTGEVGSALWGWADPTTKREYALYGISNGTAFVDVAALGESSRPTATTSMWSPMATVPMGCRSST
jgi:hypothetical protein